jgi:hypothetical protein
VLEVRAGHAFAGLLEEADGTLVAGRLVKLQPVDTELLPAWALSALKRGAKRGAGDVITDGDGAFRFQDLPAGTYRVCIDGRADLAALRVSLPHEGVWRHTLDVSGGPSGVVVDRNGVPCPDAGISVSGGTPVYVRCDRAGRFNLPVDMGLPAKLLVVCPGFALQELVLEGNERGLRFVLEPAVEKSSALFLCVSRDGRTIGQETMRVALKEARDASERELSVVVKESTAEIHDLAPGIYTLRLSMRGAATVERTDVIVPSEEALEIDLTSD